VKYKELVQKISKKNKLLGIIMSKDVKVQVTNERIKLIYNSKSMFDQATQYEEQIVEAITQNGITKPVIILFDENKEQDMEKIKKILEQPKIKTLFKKIKVNGLKSVKLLNV
jgi:disulfide oxidoreductase YuzD